MIAEKLPPTATEDVSAETAPDVFLIGGRDLEMNRISKKAKRAGAEVVDLALDQRQASNEGIGLYEDEIGVAQQNGQTAVAIELAGADKRPGIVDIDHHNDKTERPASIVQALERLGVEPSLVDRLVAANDTGHIPAMEKLLEEEYIPRLRETQGVEVAEKRKRNLMDLIRAKERQIKGVTPEMEKEAEEAIKHAEIRPDGIIVVRINSPNFDPVQDRLAVTGQNKNLIIICSADQAEKEVWFFGPGDVCKETKDHFQPKKDHRKDEDPEDTSNEYHTVGAGAGYGKEGENALILVVARDPEEIIDYIAEVEKNKVAEAGE